MHELNAEVAVMRKVVCWLIIAGSLLFVRVQLRNSVQPVRNQLRLTIAEPAACRPVLPATKTAPTYGKQNDPPHVL